jgi:hypothetical protein
MSLKNISKKWIMLIKDGKAALNHFAIIYGKRGFPYTYRLNKIVYRVIE